MKRNMELIKRIMCIAERDASVSNPVDVCIPGYSNEKVQEHVRLAQEAGYLETTGPWIGDASSLLVTRLTWSGHDALIKLREGPQD